MKQRITALFLALLLLAALSLSGCSQRPQESADGRLRVVCSLFPYYDFVRQIGGEDVDVSLLVPAGRETHSFEPTPLDVIRVSEADVFVYNGGESEVWVENILGAAGEKIPHVLLHDWTTPTRWRRSSPRGCSRAVTIMMIMTMITATRSTRTTADEDFL